MHRLALLHPLLAAAVPVLFLYAHNSSQVDARPVALVLAATLVVAAVVWGAAALVIRDAPRAACVATLALACFFLYGHVYELGWSLIYELAWQANQVVRQHHLHIMMVVLWSLGLIAGAMAIVRTQRDLRQLSRSLTSAGLVMLLFSIATIAVQSHHTQTPVAVVNQSPAAASRSGETQPVPATVAEQPDVYYIILDGYGRQDVLARDYDFDNQPFRNWLRSQGFYVADRSTTNYPRTFLSIASSLNMQYLDPQVAHRRSELVFYHMIRGSLVGKQFRERGYRYVHFATHWGGTECSYIADHTYDPFPLVPAGAFADALKQTTALRLAAGPLNWRRPAAVHRYTLDKLKEVPQIAGPTFAFAHLIIPHPPYVFDRDGRERDDIDQDDRQSYIDQLVYLNRRIEEVVQTILATSRTKPIIIVQSDHGPGFFPIEKGGKSPADYAQFFRERTPILNAYLVPERMRDKLYPTITPVNTFRLLLTECFGGDYPPLADRNFGSWTTNPFELEELTNMVPGGQPAVDVAFPALRGNTRR